MTDRRTYTGHAAAPGTALGVVHRTDRPPTRTALPHRADGDPTQQITDAFDAVAARLRNDAPDQTGTPPANQLTKHY